MKDLILLSLVSLAASVESGGLFKKMGESLLYEFGDCLLDKQYTQDTTTACRIIFGRNICRESFENAAYVSKDGCRWVSGGTPKSMDCRELVLNSPSFVAKKHWCNPIPEDSELKARARCPPVTVDEGPMKITYNFYFDQHRFGRDVCVADYVECGNDTNEFLALLSAWKSDLDPASPDAPVLKCTSKYDEKKFESFNKILKSGGYALLSEKEKSRNNPFIGSFEVSLKEKKARLASKDTNWDSYFIWKKNYSKSLVVNGMSGGKPDTLKQVFYNTKVDYTKRVQIEEVEKVIDDLDREMKAFELSGKNNNIVVMEQIVNRWQRMVAEKQTAVHPDQNDKVLKLLVDIRYKINQMSKTVKSRKAEVQRMLDDMAANNPPNPGLNPNLGLHTNFNPNPGLNTNFNPNPGLNTNFNPNPNPPGQIQFST